MADKKKGAASESGSSTRHSKASRILDGLNKICCIAKDIKDDTLGVEELEKLIDHQRRLAEQLKARDAQIVGLAAEVRGLKEAKSLLWSEFDGRYQEMATELDSLRDVKRDLEKTKAQLQKAEEAASAARSENKKLRRDLDRVTEDKRLTEEKLNTTQETLGDLQLRSAGVEVKLRELTELLGVDNFLDRNVVELEDILEDFAAKCHKTIFTAMSALPSPPEIVPSSPQPSAPNATLLQHPSPAHPVGFLSDISLSRSNSEEAKLMRCAFVENVLAKVLVDHVFVDIAALPSPGLQQAVRTVLCYLDSRDARREQIVRSQLLGAAMMDLEDCDGIVLFNAMMDIERGLHPLLGPALDNPLLPVCGSLVQDAMQLWATIRQSRERISAELDLDRLDLERADDCYPEYGPPVPGVPCEGVAPLFPQISKRHSVLLNARVLWSDQASTVKAREELKNMKARNGSEFKDGGFSKQQPRRRNSIRPSTFPPPRTATPRLVVSLAKQPGVSGNKGRDSGKGGDGSVRGTSSSVGSSIQGGKEVACEVSVSVKLPKGGTTGTDENKSPASGAA